MINSKKLNQVLKCEIESTKDIKATVVACSEGGILSFGINEKVTDMRQVNDISSILTSFFNEYKSNSSSIKDLYLETNKGKFIIGVTSIKNLYLIMYFDAETSIGKAHLRFSSLNNSLSKISNYIV
ncbi:hypothetical protein FG386_002257 [Cryptosporidium ryanae]|uniref:uncharacterized protein n=1 Tax=Cryptosporidium ryanae TaxID=515981 RepID=UPI00351AA582|nr:hypothetical protein FG386_002257 [Cryptosporidium ryanae]